MSNWKRIRQLSADEIRVRVGQKLSALGERNNLLSLGRLPSDVQLLNLLRHPATQAEFRSFDDALQHFRVRQSSSFFEAFENRETTVKILENRFGNSKPKVIEKADQILKGRFELLGCGLLSFGNPPNWHLEPVSQKITPLQHWSTLDYLDARVAGDKKIVWELNRHQFFSTLGRAYWLTGDEKYANEFGRLIQSWIEANPPKLGINWASSLEVGFRAISWLWALNFFRDSPVLTPSLFQNVLKFLYLHARHLETYLSTYFSPNTHLTGEALGLYYIGMLIPEFKDSDRWRSLGKKILIEQLPVHVRPDGVYFEQSSYYHRYTADFYTHFLILSRRNSDDVSKIVGPQLIKLLDHMMYITRPDGSSPLFGDDDGGRLVMLDEKPPNDFRGTLSSGAALFDRADYKFVADELSEETLFLLGPKGVETFDFLNTLQPSPDSKAFESGGYYVMRDGWAKDSNYLLVDCGPHGQANCGHAHADALAIEVATGGQNILVDPGTYTYTGSKEGRDWFRSSAAHSTLMIGNESSSIPAGPFSWKSIAQCSAAAWKTSARFDYFSGSHDGYLKGDRPVEHHRTILFVKNNYWIICDEVTASQNVEVSLRYNFESDQEPVVKGTGLSTEPGEVSSRSLSIRVLGSTGRWSIEKSWVSHCYASRKPSAACVFAASLEPGTTRLVSFLFPQSVQQIGLSEIEAVGGQAFKVSQGELTDIVLIKATNQVETVKLKSDFAWSWARFKEPGTLPQELIMIEGSALECGGQELVKLGGVESYAWAKSVGDVLVLETS